MKIKEKISLENVQAVYSGPEGNLWKLIMGEQIHIGGFQSSMDLAERAAIGKGMKGIDLCCCIGAGMRFLARFRGVDAMQGVDATSHVIEEGRRVSVEEGLGDKITFTLADVCSSGLPDGGADFVWGEDAWCYVVDKEKLIAEASRLVRPGGIIAFTDWIEGPKGLTDEEADRFMTFMKFPNVQDMNGYRKLLENSGCEVKTSIDTGRFHPHVELYINMLNMQLTYDALKIIGFDTALMGAMAAEMNFMKEIARDGKVIQGLFVAQKKG
ncbi:MAG: class I SAM-dependent methyltransferase [Candidatus Xenobiia bacterium LiM19]